MTASKNWRGARLTDVRSGIRAGDPRRLICTLGSRSKPNLTVSNILTNTQVLVIGGSSGIGLATAVAAGEAGASVTIASRFKVKLDAATPFATGSTVRVDGGGAIA